MDGILFGTISSGGIAILVTACATLLGVAGTLWQNRGQKRDINEVKLATNGQLTQLRERTVQLESELARHGITVPADPAISHPHA